MCSPCAQVNQGGSHDGGQTVGGTTHFSSRYAGPAWMIPERALRGISERRRYHSGEAVAESWGLCSRSDLLTSELPASGQRRATGLSNVTERSWPRPFLIVLLSTGSMLDGLVQKPAGVCTMGGGTLDG